MLKTTNHLKKMQKSEDDYKIQGGVYKNIIILVKKCDKKETVFYP